MSQLIDHGTDLPFENGTLPIGVDLVSESIKCHLAHVTNIGCTPGRPTERQPPIWCCHTHLTRTAQPTDPAFSHLREFVTLQPLRTAHGRDLTIAAERPAAIRSIAPIAVLGTHLRACPTTSAGLLSSNGSSGTKGKCEQREKHCQRHEPVNMFHGDSLVEDIRQGNIGWAENWLQVTLSLE